MTTGTSAGQYKYLRRNASAAVLLVVGRRREIRGTVYCSELRVHALSSAPCVFWVLPSLFLPSRGFPCVPFFLCASVAAAC